MVTEITQYPARLCFVANWQNYEILLILNHLQSISLIFTFRCFCLNCALLEAHLCNLQLEHDTDIYTIKGMLGHTNVKTTQIYAHIVDKSKRNAADVIHIENLATTNDAVENGSPEIFRGKNFLILQKIYTFAP